MPKKLRLRRLAETLNDANALASTLTYGSFVVAAGGIAWGIRALLGLHLDGAPWWHDPPEYVYLGGLCACMSAIPGARRWVWRWLKWLVLVYGVSQSALRGNPLINATSAAIAMSATEVAIALRRQHRLVSAAIGGDVSNEAPAS